MKKCMNCKIYVGGNGNQCPICQNALIGEGSPDNWPTLNKLRLKSMLYKMQLFVALVIAVTVFALDYLMELNGGYHWCVPIIVWALTLELLIRHFIKKSVSPIAIITDVVGHVCVLLLYTSWYFGFFNIIAFCVIPIMLMALIVTNFTLSFTEKKGNSMVYLLSSMLAGTIPYIVFMLKKVNITMEWTICLLISVIAFIAICVFKGRAVANEIEKRMNI